jgi:multidrug transporter EmrE-like cation transporter
MLSALGSGTAYAMTSLLGRPLAQSTGPLTLAAAFLGERLGVAGVVGTCLILAAVAGLGMRPAAAVGLVTEEP